ncbi:glycosyltransferase family A protein [Methylorubrum populi]|uniref:glycosyltransferase family A protein n=1 Tax=Methylorubrum populi TaxID=223967 RepID=UPI000BBB4A94|nr:glycosyltransferase family A protein [Methylorubrum populi]
MADISVIVRTHNVKRFAYLKRALLSLSVQQDVSLEVVLMTQGFASDALCLVQEWVDNNMYSLPAIEAVKVINVDQNDERRDLRCRLLNIGLSQSSSRYLAILDDDDLMYHFAYKQLVADLKQTGAAVAFGRCVRVEGTLRGDVFSATSKTTPFNGSTIIDLIVDSFCPIHSYVFDLDRIRKDELFFDEDVPYLEDYRLLLRLIPNHNFTFRSMDESICEYWFFNNMINTTNKSADPFSTEAQIWRKAYVLTEELKSNLSVNIKQIDLELWARNRIYNNIPNDIIIDSARNCIDDLKLSTDLFYRKSGVR